MGEPLKLLGAQSKVAAWFVDIEFSTGTAKRLIADFEKNPPTSEREYIDFYRTLLALFSRLDYIQLTARQGLEVARDNGVISQTTDPIAAIREIIATLQETVERIESE